MNLEAQKKLNNHIFRLLKVNEIVIPIGRTNKGNLGLKFSANQEYFEIMLDAVPLPTKSMLEDDNNIELKKMLEKYLFEQEGFKFTGSIQPQNQSESTKMVDAFETRSTIQTLTPESVSSEAVLTEDKLEVALGLKKRGRPAGSKNKVKA